MSIETSFEYENLADIVLKGTELNTPLANRFLQFANADPRTSIYIAGKDDIDLKSSGYLSPEALSSLEHYIKDSRFTITRDSMAGDAFDYEIYLTYQENANEEQRLKNLNSNLSAAFKKVLSDMKLSRIPKGMDPYDRNGFVILDRNSIRNFEPSTILLSPFGYFDPIGYLKGRAFLAVYGGQLIIPGSTEPTFPGLTS